MTIKYLLCLSCLITLCTTYNTSYDTIEVISRQGDIRQFGRVSPDGLLFAGPDGNNTDLYVRSQETGRFQLSAQLIGHVGPVLAVDIDGDHQTIVSGSADEKVIVWQYNATSGSYDQITVLDDIKNAVTDVQISDDGSTIAVAGLDPSVYFYTLQTDNYVLLDSFGQFSQISVLALDASNTKVIACGPAETDQCQIFSLNNQTNKFESVQTLTNDVHSAKWAYNSSRFFLGHGDFIGVYDYSQADGRFMLSFKLEEHNDAVTALDTSVGEQFLVSGSNDSTAFIYRRVDNTYTIFSNMSFKSEQVRDVSISTKGDIVSITYVSGATINEYGIDCKSDKHSVGTRKSNVSCVCQPKFIWDNSYEKCAVDCSLDPHSNGTSVNTETCFCLENFEWDASLSACSVNCKRDENSNGQNLNPQECGCLTKFVWNKDALKCYFDCSNISRSVHTNKNATACVCLQNYRWTDEDCYYDCSLDPNSNGTNIDTDVDSCFCKYNYTWNKANMKCELFLNCQDDRHSTGININNTQCQCQQSYRWNKVGLYCQLNCSADRNSNGTNDGVESCFCINQFKWSSQLSKCSIDCSGDKNSNGTNQEYDSCYCNRNYIWSRPVGQCIYWFECRNIPYSTGINAGNDSCQCVKQFNWMGDTHSCVISCKNDPNSNGNAASTDTCYCNSGYQWDAPGKSCISSGTQTTTVIILAIVVAVLAISVIFLIIKVVQLRKRNNPSMIRTAGSLLEDVN